MPFTVVLTLVNVVSCYWSPYKYAKYFARRHPGAIEDEKAVEMVPRIEEPMVNNDGDEEAQGKLIARGDGGRRLTVTAVGTRG